MREYFSSSGCKKATSPPAWKRWKSRWRKQKPTRFPPVAWSRKLIPADARPFRTGAAAGVQTCAIRGRELYGNIPLRLIFVLPLVPKVGLWERTLQGQFHRVVGAAEIARPRTRHPLSAKLRLLAAAAATLRAACGRLSRSARFPMMRSFPKAPLWERGKKNLSS